MKQQLTEQQIDQISRRIVSDAGLSDFAIEEIAKSPRLWWGVQRTIAEQNGAAKTPWPPSVFAWKRWLVIGVPALATIAIAAGLLFLQRDTEEATPFISSVEVQPSGPQPLPAEPAPDAVPVETLLTTVKTVASPRGATRPSRNAAHRRRATPADDSTKETISTEFIALTYGTSPESGQLVRVKVPSSMLVSLGVVPSVSKPANLIDAEVIVGDDGRTHAIRFIRQ